MEFTMLLQETENRLSEGEFTLVDVVDQDDWKAYHHIRRTVLFDARGVSGYDANHPDEHSPTNHPLLLSLALPKMAHSLAHSSKLNGGCFFRPSSRRAARGR
jgi:hypothetical protein